MNKVKVKNESHLYRDAVSNAIINTNKQEYESYLNNKKRRKVENSRIDNIEKELDDIKSNINEIKNLLLEISKNGS